MPQSTATDAHDTLNGVFELRNWKEPSRIDTPSGRVAWDLGGALVSCENAELTLAIGAPDRSRPFDTPVTGRLRIDSRSYPVSLSLNSPEKASGVVDVQKTSLWFEVELRRNRVTATLFAGGHYARSAQVQVFLFYRAGAKGPARRRPEAKPAPIVAAPSTPARQASSPPPIDSAAQLAAEWRMKLRNTQLSHADNEFDSGYGSSTYMERRVVLRLSDRTFTLDRSTLSRVSCAGLTSLSPSRSQLTGTWTILVTAPSRVRLQLTCADGERLVYVVGSARADSVVLDGQRWLWSR